MEDLIYLDFASKAPPIPCAIEAFLTAPFENPSSSHACGQVARRALEDARARIAKCMDCIPEEVYFTSTATEAAKLAVYSLEKTARTVVPSKYEHHSVSENCMRSVDLIMSEGEFVTATMLANNETGAILPKPDRYYESCWLCDATAAVGHIPVSFKDLGCDYLIADGIKFGGVSGAAFLIARDGAPLYPLICGGGQERGMRAGTENVPAICAMASALEWQCEHMDENLRHAHKLYLLMLQLLDDYQLNVGGDTANVSPYILNVSFPGVEGTALALYLSKMGVMVSTGAACSNGLNEPSHVLMAMYGDEARARSAIRISFSHTTTEEEVRTAAEKVMSAVRMLRGIGG